MKWHEQQQHIKRDEEEKEEDAGSQEVERCRRRVLLAVSFLHAFVNSKQTKRDGESRGRA